jgi:hypothetical protein
MIKMKIEQPKDGYYGQTRSECPHCGKMLSFYSALNACPHCSISLPNMRALKFDVNYRIKWHRST